MRIQFVCALVCALLLVACSQQTAAIPTAYPTGPAPGAIIANQSKLLDTSNDVSIPDVGQKAPEFEFTMPDGSTKKLSDLRGKKVVVNFWATWCDPCREEMPDLQKVHQEFGDSLVILAVNKAEKLPKIETFTNEVPVSFALIANPSGDISQRYGTRTIPNSYFINTDGTIGARALKVMDYDTIKRNIAALH